MSTTAGPTFRANVVTFQEAIRRCEPAAPTRAPLPILGGVVVEVTGEGEVHLSAFDYETSIRTPVEGAVGKESGRAVLDRRDVARVVKAATKGEARKTWTAWDVEIATTARAADGSLHADASIGGFTVPVRTFPLDDYPALPQPHCDGGLTVDRGELSDLLARVSAAAGSDDTLPMLTGVKLEQGAGNVTVAATDRFRLAVGTTDAAPGSDVSGGPVEVLLPHSTFSAIVRHLPDGALTVEVDRGGAMVRLSCGETVATARVMDHEFPRFRALLPSDVPYVVSTSAREVKRILEKAVALSRRGTVQLSAEAGELRVTPVIDDEDAAPGRVRGAAFPVGGNADGLMVRLDGRYLLDALAQFDGDVSLGVQSLDRTRRPILLAASPAELTGAVTYRHLIMPTRCP